jgi:PAS domain S-box-containing protein
MKNNNDKTNYKATTQLEQTLLYRVEELEKINFSLQSDIDARKLAHEGLRYGQKFLREVISSVEDTYFTVFDQNCVVNFVWGSKNLEEKYSIIFQDDMGKDSNDFNPQLAKRIRQVFDSNQSFHGEWQEVRKENIIWWDFTLSPIRDEDNEMVAVVSAARDITERKKIDEFLRENVSMLQKTQEIGQIGSFEMNLATGEVVWSDQLYKLFGLKKEGRIMDKEKALALIHPDDRERAVRVSSEAAKEQKSYTLEHRVIHSDGIILDLLIRGDVIRNEKNEVVKLGGTTQNITDRKKNEDLLRESEEKLKGFMDSATIGFIIFDYKLDYIDANNVALQTLGMTKDELIGKNILDVVPNLKGTGRYDKYLDVLKTGEPFSTEDVIFNRLDGNLSVYYSLRAFKAGNNLGIIFTDITDRKLDEEKLRISEERYRIIVENANENIWSYDLNLNLIYTSRTEKQILGYNPEEFKNLKMSDYTLPDSYEILVNNLTSELENDKKNRDIHRVRKFDNIKQRHKEGHIVISELSVTFLRDVDGNPTGILGMSRNVTEQRKSEELLKKSEEKYRNLVLNLVDILLEIDLNGIVTYVNPQCFDILGYQPSELIGKNAFDVIHPEDIPKVIEEMGKAIKTIDTVFYLEYRLLHKNGNIVYIAATGKHVISDGNEKLTAIIRDISENRKAEQKFKESEEKYRNLFNKAHVGIFSSRISDGKCMECNEYLVSMMGYDTIDEVLEEYIGNEHYVNLDDREKILEIVKKNGFIENHEVELTKKDGTPYWANYSVYLDLERQRLEGIAIDITDTKKKEDELHLRTEIIENMIEGVYLIRADDGIIIYANPAFEGMFGYNHGEIIGKDVSIINAPNDKNPEETTEEIINILLETGEWHGEINNIKKDGKQFWCYANVSLFNHPEHGKLLVSIHTDITERKKTEKKLKESEKMLENIFSTTHFQLVLFDKKFNFVRVNEAYAQTCGYPKDFFIGKNHFDLYPGDEVQQIFQRVVDTGEDFSIFARPFTFPDQPERGVTYWDWTLKPILDNNEEVQGLVFSLNDVTNQVKTDLKLKESERKNQAWIENSPVCTKIVDLDLNLQFMSTSGIKDLKIDDINEYYGKPYPFHFYPDSFKIPMTNNLKKAKKTGETITQEASVLDIEGNKLWYHSTIVPVKDDEGKLDYIMVVSLETTKRKQAEEQIKASLIEKEELLKERENSEHKLKESEEKWRILYENSPANIILLDKDHKILSINRPFTDLSREEVIGISQYSFLPKEFHQISRESCNSVWESGEPTSYSTNYITKDGDVRFFDVWIGPVFQSGEITALVSHYIDVTEKKEAEHKLIESEKRFRIAVENSPDHIMFATLDGLIFDINRLENGYTKETVIGHNVFSENFYESKEQFESTRKNVDDLLESGKITSFEFSKIETDGSHLFYETRVAPFEKDNNGKIISFQLITQDITERKNTENNLKENERILNNAQVMAHIGHFYLNTNTLEVSGSDELFKIFGLTTADNNLDAFANVVHPDNREYVLNHIQRSMTEGIRYDIEHRLLINDGTEKWVHAIGEALKDETGKINFVIGTVQDITELKKTMLKLSESEKRYSSFVKNYGGIAYRRGMDQVPIFFHGAVEEITGYTEKEFVEGRLPWFNLSHPDDLPSEELMYKMLNIPGFSAQREYRIYRKDGQIRWIFESGQNVSDNDGKIIAVEGTLNDITDLKRTEEALRENEGIMRSILANSPDYILMVDKNCIIQFINRELFGEKMGDIVNRKISDFIHPEYHKLVEDRIEQIFSRGKTENIKVTLSNQTGTKSLYEIRFGFIKSNWKIIAAILIMTDITEKFRIEQELQESEERFRNVIERSPFPIAITDMDGKREYQNSKFMENYGYSLSEMPTIDDWFKMVHPDNQYRQKIIEAWNLNRIEIKTRRIKPSTLKIKCKDGSYRTVVVKMEYLGGNKIFFTHEDIAELLKT